MRSKETISAPAKQASLLANEEGSVIVLALIILMLLTMVGTSATNTSTLENQVAGNERKYKQNFFRTEAAALQGSQRIQNAATHTEVWMRDETFLHDASPSTNFDNIANWTDLSGSGTEYANTHALVIYTGVAPWSSLDMTSPTQVRAFAVYGQRVDNTKSERMIIETGFAKRM